MLIEPVNLPKTAADAIAYHSFTQLFTNSHANPIGGAAIGSCIKHKQTIRLTGGMVKPLEYVIQLQCL